MKLIIWTNYPSHYQRCFFDAILQKCSDLEVLYYDSLSQERIQQGWDNTFQLGHYERFIKPSIRSLRSVKEWREAIHIIPGYGKLFLLSLTITLSINNVKWMHWSEPSRKDFGWYLNYPLKRFYAFLVNRFSVAALAIGEMARSDFISWGIRENKIKILPYSSTNSQNRETKNKRIIEFKQDKVAILYVGVLNKRKGTDLLLRAIKSVCEKYCCRLILVGKDESGGGYLSYAKKYEIEDKIMFYGVSNPKELSSIYNSCDLFILPSRFDGWGVVLNEAATHNLPLIASNKCGASFHLIEHGLNGYRYEYNDINSLINAICIYLINSELIQKHGRYSGKIAGHFTPEVNAQKLLNLISMVK